MNVNVMKFVICLSNNCIESVLLVPNYQVTGATSASQSTLPIVSSGDISEVSFYHRIHLNFSIVFLLGYT